MSWKCRFIATLSAALSCGCTAWGEVGDTPSSKPDIPDVMYIPTPPDVVDAMLQLADVDQKDVVYDLGCGDARILVAAARKFGCQAIGYDIDPARIKAARGSIRNNKLGHLVRVERRDMFDVDLSSATVVMLYLSTEYNRRLTPQLQKMPPGSRIVSHQFGIHGIAPDKTVRVKSAHDRHVHVLHRWTLPF
jgi:ribosomal protein L11 methylase PrmA